MNQSHIDIQVKILSKALREKAQQYEWAANALDAVAQSEGGKLPITECAPVGESDVTGPEFQPQDVARTVAKPTTMDLIIRMRALAAKQHGQVGDFAQLLGVSKEDAYAAIKTPGSGLTACRGWVACDKGRCGESIAAPQSELQDAPKEAAEFTPSAILSCVCLKPMRLMDLAVKFGVTEAAILSLVQKSEETLTMINGKVSPMPRKREGKDFTDSLQGS